MIYIWPFRVRASLTKGGGEDGTLRTVIGIGVTADSAAGGLGGWAAASRRARCSVSAWCPVAQFYCDVFGSGILDSKTSKGSKSTLKAEAGLLQFWDLKTGFNEQVFIKCHSYYFRRKYNGDTVTLNKALKFYPGDSAEFTRYLDFNITISTTQ